MAEEQLTEQQKKQQEQLEKLQSWVKEQTVSALKEYEAEKEKTAKPNPSLDLDKEKDPVADMLGEYINPLIQKANLQTAAVNDKVSFYESVKDIDSEMRDEVEEHFNKLLQEGRPTSRGDIYDYLLGQKIRKDPEAFVNERLKKREAQRQEAEAAIDGGAFGLTKVKDSAGNLVDPESMSHEELGKALEGMVF